MSQKPNTPKGTRDFLPETVVKRNYLTGIIKSHFEKFGFLPIETPSFEKSSTLLGKYGEEGDRLVFKILNSGDKVKKRTYLLCKIMSWQNFPTRFLIKLCVTI